MIAVLKQRILRTYSIIVYVEKIDCDKNELVFRETEYVSSNLYCNSMRKIAQPTTSRAERETELNDRERERAKSFNRQSLKAAVASHEQN